MIEFIIVIYILNLLPIKLVTAQNYKTLVFYSAVIIVLKIVCEHNMHRLIVI